MATSFSHRASGRFHHPFLLQALRIFPIFWMITAGDLLVQGKWGLSQNDARHIERIGPHLTTMLNHFKNHTMTTPVPYRLPGMQARAF
jgi:hypothetical protein